MSVNSRSAWSTELAPGQLVLKPCFRKGKQKLSSVFSVLTQKMIAVFLILSHQRWSLSSKLWDIRVVYFCSYLSNQRMH